MPINYRGKLLMLSDRDEAALGLVRNDLIDQGFKATRSGAVRYALHAMARSIVARTAGVERLPVPSAIAFDPTVMAPSAEGK